MNRSLAVLVAGLLVSAGIVGGTFGDPAGSGGPAVESDTSASVPSASSDAASQSGPEDDRHYMAGEDRYRRLELEGTSRYETITPSWNFGARIEASDGTMSAALESSAFQNRIATLSGERKERAITDRLQRLEDHVVALRASERAAVRAYARGETSAENLSTALVRSHTEAAVIDSTLTRLARQSDSDSNEGFARALRFRLNTFRSPLRQRLTETLRNGDDAVRISVRASDNGYVLGATDDGTYYREALRYDNRRPDGPKAITSGEQLGDRQEEVYNVSSFGYQQYYQGAGAYVGRMVYDFPDGEIRGFFDGGTGDVFFERNTYRLDDMERTEAVNVTNDSARLVVERTFFDGPIRITVVNPETGNPVDTTVRVAGNRVGSTGADGTLWVVEPAMPYVVSVTVNGTVVSDSVVNN